MKEIKAQFKDEYGFYTMIFTFNADLWQAKDIIQNECQNSNSQFIQFITI